MKKKIILKLTDQKNLTHKTKSDLKIFHFLPLNCRDLGLNWVEFGVFFPKRTELFPLKDYKGHLVKKSSFKGLFEIKDGRTYTGGVVKVTT